MPAPNVLEINPERLWETLERSAEIGRFRDVGLRRLALSAEDKEMRDLFVRWAKEAGCTVEIDRLARNGKHCDAGKRGEDRHEKEDGALREGITDHGCHHAPSRPW